MGFDGFGFINSDNKKASDSPVVDDSGDCGYAILGRQEDYDYNTVLSQTDLGDKLKSVQGGGDWPGELAVVKAVKSSLSNTPDGCVCPMYSFKYNSKEAYFYTWSNGKELTESVDIMNKNSANSGIRINNNFACLLNEDRTRTDYWIKFVAGCEASSEPNPDTDKYIDLIRDVSKISTNSDKPKNVKKLCSASDKTAWKCRTLLKDEHTFYLDPAKSYKDNTDLREYISKYGATDNLHVTTGLQYYGKNRESELLTIFCVPADNASTKNSTSSATQNTPTTDTNDKTDSKNNIENNTSDEWAYNGLVESPYIFSNATHWTDEGRSDADSDIVDWSDELAVYWYYYKSSGAEEAKKQTGMTYSEADAKQQELNNNGICELNPKIHLWKAVGVTATKGKQKINIDVIIGEAKCISRNLSDMGGTVCVCSVKSVSKGSIQKKWARGNPRIGFYVGGDCLNNKAGLCEETCAERCSDDFASDNENVRKLLMAWWKP